MNQSKLAFLPQLALLLCGLFPWSAANTGQREGTGAPSIPFEAAAVAGDGRGFVVEWRADHIRHVRILAGVDPDHLADGRLVAEGGVSGHATVSGLPTESRWFFELLPDRGEPLVIADRSLHLTTAANFRDAGGYRTRDGQWVRMGLVYRSNGIEHLTNEEFMQIERLHIKLVCDLRTAEEIQRGPDRVPKGANEVSADVLADDAGLIHSLTAGAAGAPSGTAAAPGATPAPPVSRQSVEERIYRDFVRLPSAQRAYQALFERLANPSQLPTVFHCTAGKDRTGWAQAVLLSILGVPRPTIVEDYLLTNQYLQGEARKSVQQSVGGAAPAAIVANPAALEAAFDQVSKDYDTLDRYLHEGLHLSDATIAALRNNLLSGRAGG